MAYVYRHIRIDKNIPFYIGIGTDLKYARARSKVGRNRLWKRIVANTDYEVEILIDVSLDEAKAKEIEFIGLYGRINTRSGSLANIAGGGDGYFNPPTHFRDALRRRNLGNKHHVGVAHSEEAKAVIGKHSSIRNAGKGNPSYKGTIYAFKDGVMVGQFDGLKACSKYLGVGLPSISSCLTGRQKTTNGHTLKRIL